MYAIAVLASIIVATLIIDPIRKRKNASLKRENTFCSCGETHVPLSKIVLEMKTEKNS